MRSAYIWLLFILSSGVVACNNNNNQNTHIGTLSQTTDTTKVKNKALQYKIDTSKLVTQTLLPKRDTLLKVDLNNNKGSTSGYLSGIGKHITIVVPVKTGDSIIAELIPESDTANIRFNQIYVPVGKGGKYDGPFGRTIRYPITVKGDYRLIVGEDLMAEGDWKGIFKCNITIK